LVLCAALILEPSLLPAEQSTGKMPVPPAAQSSTGQMLVPPAAQSSTGQMLVPPAYSGPPPNVDGPQISSSVTQPWLDPSGSAVVMPDRSMPEADSGEPLVLPGDSVMDGLPPDHIL